MVQISTERKSQKQCILWYNINYKLYLNNYTLFASQLQVYVGNRQSIIIQGG
jgi:hypothetical protein